MSAELERILERTKEFNAKGSPQVWLEKNLFLLDECSKLKNKTELFLYTVLSEGEKVEGVCNMLCDTGVITHGESLACWRKLHGIRTRIYKEFPRESDHKFITELDAQIKDFLNASLVWGKKGDKELHDRACQVFLAFRNFVE